MGNELSSYLKALGAALALALAFLLLGPVLGFELHTVPVILGCLGLVGGVAYLYIAGETADRVSWPDPPLSMELPVHPSEPRARKITQELKGTLDRTPLASRDFGRTLADLVADRMIAHHGADPEQPLANARPLLSEGLARHIERALDPDADMPRVNRATLHAYLKEIDAL